MIYSTASGGFDWTAGDTGRNDAYYFRTLEQLGLEGGVYDRVVVLTGLIQNTQQRNNTKNIWPANSETPVTIYGMRPLPGGKTQAEVYQTASGHSLEGEGVSKADKEKMIQEAWEEKFNKPDYNNWHKFDRHRGYSEVQSGKDDDGDDMGEPLMREVADDRAFRAP